MSHFKIDLHTHSSASPDGGIRRSHYKSLLHKGVLDYVAVTDHNSISFATLLQREFGNRIIVGEEIMSTGGEIVGLYLDELVPSGLTPRETAEAIKSQGGLVYIPHPFETVRKGITQEALDEITDLVDIIEVCNGRAFFQNTSAQSVVWARIKEKPGAGSSDAHGLRGVGRTYTVVGAIPTRENLVDLVKTGSVRTARPTVRALLYPKYHRLRKKILRVK